MNTATIQHEQIKPSSIEELRELLACNNIDSSNWGTGSIYTLEKLAKTLRENNVYFVKPPRLNGIHPPLTLHVHCAVVKVWYMSTPLQELYERVQIFPDGTPFSRSERFDGLGETLNFNGTAEDPHEGAHRLLREELGQTEPLFSERVRYKLLPQRRMTMGPVDHDKWPVKTNFYRNIYLCEIPYGSPLYHPEGYVEVEKPEDGGRTIYFSWKDI